MVAKLKLPRKRVEELLKRLEEDDTMTPEEHQLIKEIFEDAIRIGLVKVDAVGGTNKIVGFSMDEQDGSAGVGNGGEGVLAVGVEAGETSHATGDVVKVIYGIHPAVGAEHHGTGVARRRGEN